MNPKLNDYLPNHWLNIPNENEIGKLPTIDEVKSKLMDYEITYPVTREDIIKHINDGIPFSHYLDETGLSHVSNNKNEFVLTKTKAAWTLKPNISTNHFLYRGEKKLYESCLPTLYRKDEFNYLLENLKRAEFELLIHSHPIFRLFYDGIQLSDSVTFRLINPYGLAQHYGFNTTLLDLTSDIDVASFFATCEYNETSKKYTPLLDSDSFGVLYVYHMMIPFSFLTNEGLTTVGLQAFIRPGLQKGFLWNSHPDFSQSGNPQDLNDCKYVTKIYFKHDKVISERICAETNFGEKIFPEDELSEKCKEIFETNIFSEAAFNRNLAQNPQDTRDKNIKLLEKEGYSLSADRLPLKFSKVDKEKILAKIYNGGWDEICDSIVMPIDKDGRLMKVLRNLPYDERYKPYYTAE